MAEEESNPGMQRVLQKFCRGHYTAGFSSLLAMGLAPFLKDLLTAAAGMIVFLLLLWAAIGHRITARYHCSFVEHSFKNAHQHFMLDSDTNSLSPCEACCSY